MKTIYVVSLFLSYHTVPPVDLTSERIRVKVVYTRVESFLPQIAALNKTMTQLSSMGQSLRDYTYDNDEIGRVILHEMAEVKFVGISGEVAFNQQTGDRIAWTKIEQLQDGTYVEVAYHDQRTDNLTWIPP